MAKDIPGFYFDEDKGKYFRIQQSHRVIPGTGYTAASIKEAQQVKQNRQRAQRQVKRQEVGRIVRSRLLLNTTSLLNARLGAGVQQNRDEILRQYGAGLSRCRVDAGNPSGANSSGFMGSTFSITRQGILRASHDTRTSGPEDQFQPFSSNSNRDDTFDLPFGYMMRFPGDGARTKELMVSLYSRTGDEMCVISSDGSARFNIVRIQQGTGQVDPDVWMSLEAMRSGSDTTWDCAAAPSSPVMAFATDSGLLIGKFEPMPAVFLDYYPRLMGREQMNVCFRDHNTIMSGERSGRVNFADIRTPESVARLLHSSAVLGTSPIRDDNKVIVHGFSTTSIYDLRWVQQKPIAPKVRFTNTSHHSKAYLNFAVPRDRRSTHYTRGRKLTYSSELDLLAAANTSTTSSRANGHVTLYSVRTGKVVDSPLTRHRYRSDVKSVEIRRVRDGPESIFCFCGNSLDEWACGRLTPNEVEFYGIDWPTMSNQASEYEPEKLSIEQEWKRGNGI